MALSLTAEQKSISRLFETSDIYVVPEYQREYSWGYEHCYRLFQDIYEAFSANDDYFLGNIIIAKNRKDNRHLEVIDGQQRLITLWLVIKVLEILCPKYNLRKLLSAESYMSYDEKPLNIEIKRLKKNSHDEVNELKKLYDVTKDRINAFAEYSIVNNIVVAKDAEKKSNVLKNFTYLYAFFEDKFKYLNGEEQSKLIKFILEHTYLLPIVLDSEDENDARKKAFSIFETINSRGLNLTYSDIIKEKLYGQAVFEQKESEFTSDWENILDGCESLNIELDTLFRYYFHILRGKEGNVSTETNLYDFFILRPNAPTSTMKYSSFMEDLKKIIEVFKKIVELKQQEGYCSSILRLLDTSVYVNDYPMYAIVNYMFVMGSQINDEFKDFLRYLLRYSYAIASRSIKFKIYLLNKYVWNKSFEGFDKRIDTFEIAYKSRLTKYYSMLYYCIVKNKLPLRYQLNRYITGGEYSDEEDPFRPLKYEIGNYYVVDSDSQFTTQEVSLVSFVYIRSEEMKSSIARFIFEDKGFVAE